MVDITKMGRKRANPSANSLNNLKLSVCAETASCLDYYEAAVPATETVQSVTIDGVVTALPTPVLVTNVDSIRDQIAGLLASGDPEEFDVFVRVKHGTLNGVANTLSFAHVGTKVISAITTNIGAKVVARQCTTAVHVDYELTLQGAIANLGNGTAVSALATGTYNYTTNPATNATTAATLRTDILTALAALSVTYRAVNVTVNTSLGAYNIEIKRQADGVTLFAGNSKFKVGNGVKTFLNFPIGL